MPFLAVDVGNSRVKVACVEADAVGPRRLIATHATDEEVSDLLGGIGIELSTTPCGVCSVVLDVAARWERAYRSRGGRTVFHVNSRCRFSFTNLYEPPEAIGPDRLAACEAALQLYRAPLAVFSFGTALAVTVVDTDRRLRGGFIYPGFGLSFDALASHGALLKGVPRGTPGEEIGVSSAENISRGIYNGFLGVIGQFQRTIERQIGGRVFWVATGGDASTFADRFDAVHEDLVLVGIYCLYLRSVAP